jgi:prepilin-type N-terminal cleavage/methylation domain-containing protein
MKMVRLNSRSRKAFQGRSWGFTLIEVLIAIAIMGVIAITFLSALSTSSLALMTADKRATAESLARSQMEYVKNQQYESAPDEGAATYDKITDVVPAGYSIWSYNRTGSAPVEDVLGIPWDSATNTAAPTDSGLQKIKLVIEYGNDQIITLEGYKREPGG